MNWLYGLLSDWGSVIALIGYGIGAARWAATMHTEVKLVRQELSFLKQFKRSTDKDSETQWEKLGEHDEKLSDHGERIARTETRVDFHEQDIGWLKEKVQSGS